MKFHLPFLYTLLLGGCAAFLPSLDERTQSSYLDIPATPRLDSALGIPSTSSKTDISHIYLLNDAHEAFVARAALIESADHTLDLQYYIWHNDISGKLLFNLIHRAAERGVRVRLLLDDNNTNGMDDLLLALDNHPNIEVRLFNPFIFRNGVHSAMLPTFRDLTAECTTNRLLPTTVPPFWADAISATNILRLTTIPSLPTSISSPQAAS